MRKLIFALAIAVTGMFAFASGGPAKAATAAAPVSGISDVVNSSSALETVHYRRHRHWHRNRHWRHRHWRHRHYRHHRAYRRCWWRHGYRYCRWVR